MYCFGDAPSSSVTRVHASYSHKLTAALFNPNVFVHLVLHHLQIHHNSLNPMLLSTIISSNISVIY